MEVLWKKLKNSTHDYDYFSVGKPYRKQHFDVVKTYTPTVSVQEQVPVMVSRRPRPVKRALLVVVKRLILRLLQVKQLILWQQNLQERHGVIMTEVFRVVTKIEGGGEGYLSGKIYFSTLNQHKYLYKQGEHGGQYIKGKCDLLTTVTGRDHVIQSDDYVVCFVDLLLSNAEYQPLANCEIPQLVKQKPNVGHFDENGNFYDSNGTLCDFFEQKRCDMNDNDTEDELDEYEGKGNFIRISNCKGCFGKNGRLKEHKFHGLAFSQFTHRRIFDKPQHYKVNSPDNKCSVTILYAFFREAVQATLEVILKDEHSEEFGVYGLIAARNDMIKEDDYEIILFLKDLSQSVTVVSGKPIQLSRSLVAVPINSNLLVRVHLRTKDKQFPSAQLIFPAQQSGISELPINDRMQVKVTWELYW